MTQGYVIPFIINLSFLFKLTNQQVFFFFLISNSLTNKLSQYSIKEVFPTYLMIQFYSIILVSSTDEVLSQSIYQTF